MLRDPLDDPITSAELARRLEETRADDRTLERDRRKALARIKRRGPRRVASDTALHLLAAADRAGDAGDMDTCRTLLKDGVKVLRVTEGWDTVPTTTVNVGVGVQVAAPITIRIRDCKMVYALVQRGMLTMAEAEALEKEVW